METIPQNKVKRVKQSRQVKKFTDTFGKDTAKISDESTNNLKAFRAFKLMYDFKRYTINDFKTVIAAINKYYLDYMLSTGDMVILPNGMGKIVVRKFKKPIIQKQDGTLNLPVDWKETNAVGQKVYYTNSHTEGNSFSWMWLKDKSRLSKPTLWRFQPIRTTKKLLADYVRNNDDWDKFHYMTDATREYLIKQRLKREQNAREQV